MSDYYTRDFDSLSNAPRKENLFLWTVFILLLMGFAMACWLGSFYIFGHPENVNSYRILQKLHKLDPPKRFEITAAPPGEFLTPQKLYERYNLYPPLRLKAENDELLRLYIDNYQSTKRLAPYIVGTFTILKARELKPSDLFPSGVAAVAQATDFPQVLLEHVYTADAQEDPALKAMLKTGLEVKLAKTLDLAAIIHIERLPNGSLQFTAVPLLYGSYALRDGQGTFSLAPPPGMNLAAGLPIIRGPELNLALQDFAQYQRENTPVSTALDQPLTSPAAAPPAASELVRVNATPAAEISVPMHARRVKGHASPKPATAIAAASPAPAHSQPPLLAMENTPEAETRPEAASRSIPVSTPVPYYSSERPRTYSNGVPSNGVPSTPAGVPSTPAGVPSTPAGVPSTPAGVPSTPAGVPTTPNGVPLTPFLQAAPAPVIENNGANWRTYAPGQMPRGRVIDPADAAPLAENGMGGERLYLRGNFVVTASEENRAVLRPQGGVLSGLLKPGAGATRVIVEYPATLLPPAEGSTFARDENRPFLITDVRRGADGQINLYVREITSPQQ